MPLRAALAILALAALSGCNLNMATLKGTMYCDDGATAAGMGSTITLQQGGVTAYSATITNIKGMYSIDGIAPGTYDVLVSIAGSTLATVYACYTTADLTTSPVWTLIESGTAADPYVTTTAIPLALVANATTTLYVKLAETTP